MLPWKTARLERYGIALAGVALVAAIRFFLDPWLSDRSAYMPYVFAIMAVALWLGEGPAILAVLLSAAAGSVIAHRSMFESRDVVEIVLFVATAAGIILMSRLVRRSNQRLKIAELAADHRGAASEQLAIELNLLIDGAHGLAIYMLDPAGRVMIWNRGPSG